MATPQPVVVRGSWTANRILMLVAGILFALASLALAFGWNINPWILGFGGFSAIAFAWCI